MLRTRRAMEELDVRAVEAELRRGERGSIATQTALAVPAMLGFTAVAVDAAYLYVEEAHLQTVTDATALAVASAYQTQDFTDVAVLRAETIAENKKINGSAYDASGFTVNLGSWTEGGGFTAFTVTNQSEFNTLMSNGDVAVEVIATGQASPLFFGMLFTGTNTMPVGGRSVVAYRAIGVGPPQNCGVLSNVDLEVGGSVGLDGYTSDDCKGSGYIAPPNSDLNMGVCSNGDAFMHGSAKLYGSMSWGPDSDDTLTMSDGMAPIVTPQQLAQDVAPPTVVGCAEGGADDLASDAFWADIENWRKCIDTDGDGEPDGAEAKDAKSVVDVKYDAVTDDWKVKVNDNSSALALSADCGAPEPMCIHDLETTGKGAVFVDPESYGSDAHFDLMLSGDLDLTGQGMVNLDDTEYNSSTGKWESTGNSAGDLMVFAQGSVELSGGAEFSGVVTAQGTLDFKGNSDLWGDFFALGAVRFIGNADAHLDRCYEINDTNNDTDTQTNRLVLVE